MDQHYSSLTASPKIPDGAYSNEIEHFLANTSQELLFRLQVTQAPLSPNVEAPSPVHYSVTIIITTLVSILFLLVYIQLFMVICFGYKLLTYQTVLLFDILLWAALRVTLYSFYFYHCCKLVNTLHGTFLGWLLVSFPSCLQYFSLALLVHYFGESIFKVFTRRQEMSSLTPAYRKMKRYRVIGEFLWASSVLTFLIGSVTFYFTIDTDRHVTQHEHARSVLVIIRVVLLDGLFLVMGITLGVCITMIYTTRWGKDFVEAQGRRKCVPPFISILLILLFASRDIYSLVAAISGADNLDIKGNWIFVTDEGDYGSLTRDMDNKYGYIAYFAVLMVWEVIPTYIIVFFFRVTLPRYHDSLMKPYNTRRRAPSTNQKHFFENPNRYDENEQLLHQPAQQRHSSTSTHVSIPSLTGSTQHHSIANPYIAGHYGSGNGYGSTSRGQPPQHTKHYSINATQHHSSGFHGNSHPVISSVMPGTTPPQLFTSPSFFTDPQTDQ